MLDLRPYNLSTTIMVKKHIEYVAFEGKKITVEWYYNKNLKSSGLEYYESLDKSQKEALYALFLLLDRQGKILNPVKFNFEGDKIYAFKPDGERFICFFAEGAKIIITHGFRKKTQKMPPQEKEKATKRRKDYFKRVARGEYYDD